MIGALSISPQSSKLLNALGFFPKTAQPNFRQRKLT